ncbi:NnrU family protein [Hymenobacter arizonensis]|uniref:Protein-S-isoprenylcysteine O-methyltransferase Ste14 n=1 Tax=Hymenobacter arizonensis TaxID=1227077 RepID=A0A1I5ZBJ1_HYMAR|nr:NnrU family protein [Hymenobacter arizonensis]SFQ53813.1 Protein-S-isoprenylcysteine O-methyltransferase Ste14 [Hymenobacter arizonensis]
MLQLASFWTLYFGLHSLLATTWLKEAVARQWPSAARFYRLFYNQVSVWGFLLILRYQNQLPETQFFTPSLLALGLGYALLATGVVVAVAALRGYDLAEFAGWAYVRRGSAAANVPLQTGGFNGVVRHPLYLGVGLGLLGFWLLAPTGPRTVFVGCNLAYLLVGTRLEERKLLTRFGAAYARYQKQVPQLLPLKGRNLTSR